MSTGSLWSTHYARGVTTTSSRRLDPIGPVLGVLSAAFFWLNGFDDLLTRDLALYAYAGQQVAEGVPPYVGVMNRSGPLAHLVPGFGAWLAGVLGADDLMTMRVMMLVLTALIVWASYAVARDSLASRLSGVVAAAFVATIPAVSFYASAGPREKTTMLLLLLGTLWALRHQRWAVAGALLALATLTWQPVFFPGAATALVAILLSPGQRARGLLRGTLAGVAVTALFVAYFAAAGALPEALDGFIRIHIADTYQPGFSSDPAMAWAGTLQGLHEWTYLVVAGLVLLPAWAAHRVVRLLRGQGDDEQRLQDVFLVAAAVGEIAGLVWTYRTYNGWGDALVLVPYAALGLACLVGALLSSRPRAGRVLATAACLALLAGGTWFALSDTTDDLTGQREQVNAVLAVLPDATMLSIEAPQPLVLGHRVNPTQHQMFRLGLETYVDDTWPGGLQGYAEDIVSERPTIVVIGFGARYEWLMPLEAAYERFGTGEGWYWYVDRDSVDAPTLERLKVAAGG